jgi:hypothetical protein
MGKTPVYSSGTVKTPSRNIRNIYLSAEYRLQVLNRTYKCAKILVMNLLHYEFLRTGPKMLGMCLEIPQYSSGALPRLV